MEIILRSRSKRAKSKVERDHQWYDYDTKTMLRGRGGEMRFRQDNGKTVPYLVDHESARWKNDYDDILRWVKHNSSKFEVLDFATGHFVLIDVQKNEIDNITYDLQQHDIMFDD